MPTKNNITLKDNLKRSLVKIVGIADKTLFGIGFIVIINLIIEQGFFLPDNIVQIIDTTTIIVIWFFVVHYILLLLVSIFLSVLSKSKFFILNHFKRKWFNLFLTLAIVTQQAIFFNWFGIESLQIFLHSIDYRLYTKLYIAVTQTLIVSGFIVDFIRYSSRLLTFRFHPSQIIVISYCAGILLGAMFLMMPKATTTGHINFIDALFTSASALCVTGLTVVNTSACFTSTGQFVILVLMQLGGIGIISFSTYMAMFFGQGISFKQRTTLKDILNEQSYIDVVKILKHIFWITLIIECIGTVFLYISMYGTISFALDAPEQKKWFYALFHTVSAFCNAGFSLWPNNLMNDELSWNPKIIIMTLIILGGLGYSVLSNLISIAYDKIRLLFKSLIKIVINNFKSSSITNNENDDLSLKTSLNSVQGLHEEDLLNKKYRISLQTKFVLTISLALIILGMVTLCVLEWNHGFKNYDISDRLLHGLFQSVSARTAGFNTIDVASLSVSSVIIMLFLMFIGASPGSTGGGIKTTTFGIMLVSSFGNLKGSDRISVFKKTITQNNITRALMVITFSIIFIFIITFILSVIEKNIPIIDLVFEIISAFATVGLSRGITSELTEISKYILVLCMFVGRVGILSLAFAVGETSKTAIHQKYPEESMMIG